MRKHGPSAVRRTTFTTYERWPVLARVGLARACVAAFFLGNIPLHGGCSDASFLNEAGEPRALVDDKAAWTLTFADEFEGARGTSPAQDKWTAEEGTDWGNGQLEYDTARSANVALDGAGHLAITARREDFRGQSFTSARISTRGHFAQRYGRFEARLKLPRGQGLWPAFWLLGESIEDEGWPACGEIDILEFRGQTPDEIRASLHGPGYLGGNNVGRDLVLDGRDLSEDFHLVALEWTAEGMAFYLDEKRYFRVLREEFAPAARWPFDQPFFVILNLAVGGNYVGPPDASTQFPQTLLVDYVRIYALRGS